MKDINGATPVPGPIKITGVPSSFGNEKVPFFISPLTKSPYSNESKYSLQRPLINLLELDL